METNGIESCPGQRKSGWDLGGGGVGVESQTWGGSPDKEEQLGSLTSVMCAPGLRQFKHKFSAPHSEVQLRVFGASVQTQILSPSFRNPAQGLWSKASESCREDSKEPWTRSPRALGDKFSFASLKHLLESHRASVFILCKMVPITITWGPSLVAQW